MAGDEHELHRLAECRNETHYRRAGFGCAQPAKSAQPAESAQGNTQETSQETAQETIGTAEDYSTD